MSTDVTEIYGPRWVVLGLDADGKPAGDPWLYSSPEAAEEFLRESRRGHKCEVREVRVSPAVPAGSEGR